MIVQLACGHVIDDAIMDTVCTPRGHYPIGTGPTSFYKRCDLYRPCVCDATTHVNTDGSPAVRA
jgi:hypothetical protein